MPKKKSLLKEKAEQVEKEVFETRPGSYKDPAQDLKQEFEQARKAEGQELCSHQNKHYTDGELFCVLVKEHGGDHIGYVGDKITAWSDAAGTPARKHA